MLHTVSFYRVFKWCRFRNMSNLAEQSCDNNISLMRVDQVHAPFVGNTDCVPALSITKMPEICDVVDGSGEGIVVKLASVEYLLHRATKNSTTALMSDQTSRSEDSEAHNLAVHEISSCDKSMVLLSTSVAKSD